MRAGRSTGGQWWPQTSSMVVRLGTKSLGMLTGDVCLFLAFSDRFYGSRFAILRSHGRGYGGWGMGPHINGGHNLLYIRLKLCHNSFPPAFSRYQHFGEVWGAWNRGWLTQGGSIPSGSQLLSCESHAIKHICRARTVTASMGRRMQALVHALGLET